MSDMKTILASKFDTNNKTQETTEESQTIDIKSRQ